MTIQEVRALIDAKIKGQGTNVDAGSVLPIILNGILDLINEGGGGTSDAVQYIPQELTTEQQAQARTNIGAGTSNFNGNPVLVTEQELTESQQMQARKNLDLYYEETSEGEKTLTWNGDIDNTPRSETLFHIGGWGAYGYRVSDEVIDVSKIVKIEFGMATYTLEQLNVSEQENCKVIYYGSGTFLAAIVNDDADGLTAGVYFFSVGSSYTEKLVYSGIATTIHQIPAKYIPDMPSGGIENFTLLSLPTNYAMNVAKTTFFASEDWEEINGLEVFTASYNKGQAGERDFLVINDGTNLTFYGQYGVEFILSPYYVEGYVSGYPINGGQIQLSGLPNASMTSAELEALGFGVLGGNFSYWSSHCFNIVKINDLFAQQLFGIIALTSNYLEFWDATNKYVITVSLGQLSCTVTPR